MEDLSSYIVPVSGGLGTIYYIPEFITEDEEEYLLRKIREARRSQWKNLSNRRLQMYGGEISKPANVLIPSPLPSFLVDYPSIIPRLQATGVFASSIHGQPNHVLINEYEPGQGIMPHQDGPSYHPVVGTISLGSHTVSHYYQYKPSNDELPEGSVGQTIDPNPVASVLLERRSLVITTSELYTNHLHGISDVSEDHFSPDKEERGSYPQIANVELIRDAAIKACIRTGETLPRSTRVSLTCRDVEKVMAGPGKLFGRKT